MTLAAAAKRSGLFVGHGSLPRLHLAWNFLHFSPTGSGTGIAGAASVLQSAPTRLKSRNSCNSSTTKCSKRNGQSASAICAHSLPRSTQGGAALAVATAGFSVFALGWQGRNSSSSSSSSGSRIAHCASCPSRGSRVYVWGSNIDGQVGVGSALSVSLPVVLSSLPLRPNETVLSLSGGPRHSACVTSEGRVFSWGRGGAGDCGGPSAAEGPQEVLLPLEKGDRPLSVCCGNGFSLVVTEMGCLYTWGSNSHGQCGRPPHEASSDHQELGLSADKSFLKGIDRRDVFGGRARSSPFLPPGKVGGLLATRKVVGASCGDRMCAAVTSDGEVFVWGDARAGGMHGGDRTQEGRPLPHEPRLVPLPAEEEGGPARAVSVACGESHCMALSERGFVYTWGSNFYGQLGLGGGPRTVEGPQLVSALKDQNVVAVACGAQHSLCLTQDGKVFVWGYGKDGQCAEPTHLDVPLPLQVDFGDSSGTPSVGRCTQISGGEGHSLALCGEGKLYVWGRGREGQLGRGGLIESPAASRDVPVEVTLGDSEKVVLAACGGCHTVAATRPSTA
ncbi:regulator of chromosome condensation domain-containing protein, putative [Eimeria acervulina]|uniref:Regulator of chromosome condensation domain-containing protein, putative n=1 Tax=Eimeria acervulina TaxID=5801 RepID=U6GW49_EIMAC|nr:regulator of chromosome condensation domain-containing protein, putative [Eimeria acervulina]CDI83812.1 regulator of chromosome condensation domain-containing protein, putative [Eimeria acervulina]